MTEINDDTPLGEVRAWLRERVDDGAHCPACTQLVKVYRRPLSNATARVMIAMWRRGQGRDWEYLTDLYDEKLALLKGTAIQGGYGVLGHHWGLLEPRPGVRDDGSNRVGWWRLTDLGRAFVQGTTTVPKYAHLYNGRCLGHSGDDWSIRQALGSKFNYDELMGGIG